MPVGISTYGVIYQSADELREHITFLAKHDPDTLADLALGLLADLERERGSE